MKSLESILLCNFLLANFGRLFCFQRSEDPVRGLVGLEAAVPVEHHRARQLELGGERADPHRVQNQQIGRNACQAKNDMGEKRQYRSRQNEFFDEICTPATLPDPGRAMWPE